MIQACLWSLFLTTMAYDIRHSVIVEAAAIMTGYCSTLTLQSKSSYSTVHIVEHDRALANGHASREYKKSQHHRTWSLRRLHDHSNKQLTDMNRHAIS
jgi:hypothetical protein